MRERSQEYKDRKNARARVLYLGQREQILERNKAWAAANPEKVSRQKRRWRDENRHHVTDQNRAYNLWRNFKLTTAQWDELFEQQGRVCASCGSPSPGGKFWHTDHNPRLTKDDPRYVRGILCLRCNITAHYGVTPEWARRLALYLEKHQ